MKSSNEISIKGSILIVFSLKLHKSVGTGYFSQPTGSSQNYHWSKSLHQIRLKVQYNAASLHLKKTHKYVAQRRERTLQCGIFQSSIREI